MACIISRLAGSSLQEVLNASDNAYKTMQISVDSNNQLKIDVPGWEKAQEIYNKIFRFALPFSIAAGALGLTCTVVITKTYSHSNVKTYAALVASCVAYFFALSGVVLIHLVNKRNRRFEEMPKQIKQFRTDLLRQSIARVKELHQKLPKQWKDKVSFNVLSENELLTLIQQTKDPALILSCFCWIPKEMSIEAPLGRIFKAEHSFKHSPAGIMLAEKLIQLSKIALEINHGKAFWNTLYKTPWTPITDELHSKALNAMLRKQLDLLCSDTSQVPDVKTMIWQYCDEAKKLYFAQLFKTAIDATCEGNHDEHVASVRQSLEAAQHSDNKLLLEAFELSITK